MINVCSPFFRGCAAKIISAPARVKCFADVQMSDDQQIRASVNRDDPETYNLTGWICEHALDNYLGKLEQVAGYR